MDFTLEYPAYFGGLSDDKGYGIAVDDSGNANVRSTFSYLFSTDYTFDIENGSRLNWPKADDGFGVEA